MIRQKAAIALINALCWVLFMGLIIGFVSVGPGGDRAVSRSIPSFLIFFAIYILFFYANRLLVDKLYKANNYLPYALLILALFFVFVYAKPFERLLMHQGHNGGGMPGGVDEFRPERRPALDIISIILFVMTWSVSTLLGIIRQWRSSQLRAQQAEQDKAAAELSFLKAQVNPHFLFNTLNNIYSLTVSKSDEAPDAVMKLSNIMRYVTDEVAQDFVALQSEINCITDYVDLQRLRLNEKAAVRFIVEGSTDGKEIAPMLLMAFVENVFKHGTSSHEYSDSFIKISVEGNQVVLLCNNKIFPRGNNMERPGIGISNTRKRLAHLYPERHILYITEEAGYYTIQLTLQLS
jgi:two-component system LytT family sensor kinase